MDALIATFVEEYKQRVAMFSDDPEGNLFNDGSSETDGNLTWKKRNLYNYNLIIIFLKIVWSHWQLFLEEESTKILEVLAQDSPSFFANRVVIKW